MSDILLHHSAISTTEILIQSRGGGGAVEG